MECHWVQRFFLIFIFFKANVRQTLRCLAEISFLRCCTFAFMQLNPVILVHFRGKLTCTPGKKRWPETPTTPRTTLLTVQTTASRIRYNSVLGIKMFCWILVDLLLVAAGVQDHLGRLRITVRFDIKTSPLRKQRELTSSQEIAHNNRPVSRTKWWKV